MANDYTYKVSKQADGDIEVSVEVGETKYKEVAEHAYHHLKDSVTVDGFRAGKAPREVIEAKLGSKLLEHTINDLLPEVAEEILTTEKLEPISQVEYSLEDFGDDKKIKFKFSFAVYPEIKLGDFKKIKVKKESDDVTDKEIDDVLVNLFSEKYAQANPAQEGDKKDQKPEDRAKEVLAWIHDAVVTEVMGEKYKKIDDLKVEIKDQLKSMKSRQNEDKYLTEVLAEAVKLSNVAVPKRLIKAEASRYEEDYTNRVKELGMELDTFLAAQNNSLDKLRADWQKQGEQKLGNELLLSEIVRVNDIAPTMQDVQAEIDKLEDPKLKTDFNTTRGKRYVASVLIQQRGMQKLLEILEADAKK
jgi:trigger factor